MPENEFLSSWKLRQHDLHSDISINTVSDSALQKYFHGYTCLALWKHHVNLLLQSFRSVSSDLHQCYNNMTI